MGTDRRLPEDMESTIFRVLDEALASYLALGPEKVSLRLDWSDELEASLSAERSVVLPAGHEEALPEIPTGDVPDQIRQMIEERHEARTAALDRGRGGGDHRPARRGPARHPRAGRVDRRDGRGACQRRGAPVRRAAAGHGVGRGCERFRWRERRRGRGRSGRRRRLRRDLVSDHGRTADNGPGILETSIVLGGAVLLALAIIYLFGGRSRTSSACSWTRRTAVADGIAVTRRRASDSYLWATGRFARPAVR